MTKRASTLVTFLAGWVLIGLTISAGAYAQEASDSTRPPEGSEVREPWYEQGPGPEGLLVNHAPVIRVYKDSNAWFGENRDHNTLLAMGKVLGQDYFIHPLAALSHPIPGDTAVVLLTSNGFGLSSAVTAQNAAAAQVNLDAFVRAGGTLIVDMGDNVGNGGFKAPGASGTPSSVFPSPCADATLSPAALGPDAILGTADDHPLVLGPDGFPGTFDDLDHSNIDTIQGCYVAHGNLANGIVLPNNATALMTALFGGVPSPILAEYCLDGGLVILDTITKEFKAHQGPQGQGSRPTFFMTNLFTYALSGIGKQQCLLEVGVDVKPQSCPNPWNVRSRGVLPVAIAGTHDFDVTRVDPLTVTLAGVPPIRHDFEDVTTPFAPFLGKGDCSQCIEAGADGFTDLTLKFDRQAVLAAIEEDQGPVEDGDCLALILEGELFDGRPIAGEDVVLIVDKK